MKFSEEITAVVDKRIFENYLFNETHFLGKLKRKYFEEIGFEEKDIPNIVEQLKMFPFLHEIQTINMLKETRFLSYQISINGILISSLERKIPVKTYWIYEQDKITFISLALW